MFKELFKRLLGFVRFNMYPFSALKTFQNDHNVFDGINYIKKNTLSFITINLSIICLKYLNRVSQRSHAY